MNAPKTYLSCITRAVESTPSQTSLTHAALRLVACRRCGGLLVDEHCMEMEIGPMRRGYWARRCIQCGDMIDETILRNRCAPRQTLQEIVPSAGSGQAFAPSPIHDGKGGRYATLSHASPTIRRPPSLRTIDTIH